MKTFLNKLKYIGNKFRLFKTKLIESPEKENKYDYIIK